MGLLGKFDTDNTGHIEYAAFKSGESRFISYSIYGITMNNSRNQLLMINSYLQNCKMIFVIFILLFLDYLYIQF